MESRTWIVWCWLIISDQVWSHMSVRGLQVLVDGAFTLKQQKFRSNVYFFKSSVGQKIRDVSPQTGLRCDWLNCVCVCVWCVQSAEAESQWVEDLVWFHQSRVRDVEWITGLDFYQGSHRPIPELLRMKTRPTAAIQRKPWNGCFSWKKLYTDSLSVCEGGPDGGLGLVSIFIQVLNC